MGFQRRDDGGAAQRGGAVRVAIDGRKIRDYGIGTYIRGLLRGLDEIGGNDEYIVLAPESARDVIPPRFTHVALDAPHYSIRELFMVGRAAERAGADLLHAPHYVVPYTGLPVVVTIHDLIHLSHSNPLARLYARTMIGRAASRARRVLTVSEAVKDDIVRTFRTAPEKVIVTPNGIDEVYRAGASAARRSRYFLFVGNDKPHKNLDRLIEAFEMVRRDAPGVSLVLVGSEFERFHERIGVIASGFTTEAELAALYRNAIALVQPSLDEGFGLPAAEAMASGTAVITSNARALLEVTGDAAVHVDANSVESIAAAMRSLLADDAMRAKFAQRGVERARKFNWRRTAEMTRDVYRDAFHLDFR